MLTRMLAGFAAALALIPTAASSAAPAYPSHPIKIIVPFSTGSASDTTARIVAEKLSARLQTPVVVDNKAGASGTIGSREVARAKNDGYTFILTSSSTHSATPALFKNLPYDPVTDFTHVIRIATIPMMLVVNGNSKINSVADLVKTSKAGGLNYGYGSASAQTAGATFNLEAGLTDNRIAYKSQPQAITDLLGGHIDYLFGDLSVVTALIKNGQLRGIAASSDARLNDFPNVPTLDELGYKLNITVWVGLAAPAGTPEDVVALINKEVAQILASPDVVERFKGLGMQVAPNSVAEHAQFTQQQKDVWTARVKAAGIEAQ
ncbi:tripartite tricarboxylate transporter substrate binding protein [Pusillimonas sp. TS35]|uniref:Bug family tripartite tricarboxylate transporter substrate binding protein n=1 Tax=Paracandidimonas lactea TaxID=2895524 RepID=UPI00136F9490|nr:tripartite tricarboxylate transporter substrate binding protein [Paracandidimonas lactea]MYN14270.1 tripartite tricarboxylate transporter substrate binding protein [Pusillimonas sp. TS35]